MSLDATSRDRESDPDRFAILLCTYNGEAHLAEQLASIERQTVTQIDIWLSDDGSTDATLELAQDFASRWTKGSFRIVAGPRAGFAENFRSLLSRRDIDGCYVAFCDQDDVWDFDKLQTARDRLGDMRAAVPALYCGATRIVSEDGRPISTSPIMRRPPSFRNALIQSIAGGNTMVMNAAAFRLMRKASEDNSFVSHDWWAYMVVTGAGGTVIYDPVPRISYRQHEGNAIGANNTWSARIARFRMLMTSRFQRWNTQNFAALERCAGLFTDESRRLVEELPRLRARRAWTRLRFLSRNGIHRQTVLGNISLYAAALLKRL